MTHALGPVVGNALQTKPEAPKPHLRERLRPWAESALGTVERDADGKLSFAPSYAGECPVSLPVVYREPAYVPKTDFGVAVEPEAAVTFKAEAFDPKASPLQVGDRVKQVHPHYINLNHYAVVERIEDNCAHIKWEDPAAKPGFPWNLEVCRCCFEIVSRGTAQEAAAAFDPMTEPLQVGDEVEVVFSGWPKGQRDTVTAVRPDGGFACKESGGWTYRSSLKLIRKAAA
jgi:hypothetical protein